MEELTVGIREVREFTANYHENFRGLRDDHRWRRIEQDESAISQLPAS